VEPPTHTLVDHTGDIAADLRASSVAGLFRAATVALLDVLTDAVPSVGDEASRALTLDGIDAEDLLVALGNELLFLFEVEGFLARDLHLEELDETTLRGTLRGALFDPERHPIARPIKAVTHHQAHIEEHADGSVTARLVFDL